MDSNARFIFSLGFWVKCPEVHDEFDPVCITERNEGTERCSDLAKVPEGTRGRTRMVSKPLGALKPLF